MVIQNVMNRLGQVLRLRISQTVGNDIVEEELRLIAVVCLWAIHLGALLWGVEVERG